MTLEEDCLILKGHVEHGSLLFEERCLYGSSTELVDQLESLKDHLRKKEDDVFQGEVEAQIISLIICGVVEESAGWEKSTLTRQEALRGQLTTIEAQYPDIDSLKKC